MKNWIDFDMMMSVIKYLRNNAQRRISQFKENENPSEFDRHQYHEAVGEESVLRLLQAWCYDFKFSSEDVRNMIDEETKKESLPSAKKIIDEISMDLGLKSEETKEE